MKLEAQNIDEPQKKPLLIADVSSSYIGKECFWVDKVTHKKTYDGRKLGKCVDEGVHSFKPIVWFERPFLGFTWQYKLDVRL